MYPNKLIIVPLENTVLLPSGVLRLSLRGKEASELVKAYFRHNSKGNLEDTYVACVPLNRPLKSVEMNTSVASQAPPVPVIPASDEPEEEGLVLLKDRHRLKDYGCLARITRVQRSGANLFGVFVEGLERFKINNIFQQSAFWMADVSYWEKVEYNDTEFNQLCESLVTRMRQLKLPESLLDQLSKATNAKSTPALADLVISLIETSFEEKLLMLSTPDLEPRLKTARNWIIRQLHVLQLTNTLSIGIEGSLSNKQHEFYLRQQLDAIQKGPDPTSEEDELIHLHKKLVNAQLPNEALEVAEREIKRIKHLQPSSSEWGVSRLYLEWLSDLPWSKKTVDSLNISNARDALNRDHFGLEPVKKRILEHLSIIKIKGDVKTPILCLVGPPGVGKTSLGRSIANSMSRKFHRIALGGIRDEASIRGHRRTYVGAMPGLIIQGLRKCKTRNPLILLDEIDKVATSNHNGDPAAALLEVLDPEQNSTFADHYLNVPFDLSGVLFIATANSLDTIPEPLLDRMEVLEVHGYNFEEKLHIAKTHLIPKQVLNHGLLPAHIGLSNDTILYIAERYTRESGVRNLERTIASVIRAKCVQLAELKEQNNEASYSSDISIEDVIQILGNAKFEKEAFEYNPCPGVVTGLAYSGSGNGGILLIEATKIPGYGKLYLTGSLGNVLQESAQIAFTWVKGNAYALGLTSNDKEKLGEQDDVHIHIPNGSVPKDGPSAGITLTCALISLYSGQCVAPTTAMTGEMSLRGQVLPVGGIKEKVVSAHRAGIRQIVLPFKNKTDVETGIPLSLQADIEFCFVQTIWQMLESVFRNEKWAKQDRIESHL
ncbi:ATP-dependent protease La [Sporodiniella umbellata]|nr:ATP-dependent protease La [Sporodiniella umbellata]